MKAQIWGLLAESPIHAGSGQSTGFVDLPVSREAATDHPIIPGSSIKGALRDLARQRRRGAGDAARQAGGEEEVDEIDRTFGMPDRAGDVLISDARLVLLPVRSMTSTYRWVTCPYVIERLLRDRGRVGQDDAALDLKALCAVPPGAALVTDEAGLFLEERQFARAGGLPRGLVALIGTLITHAQTRARLAAQLVVLHDEDFAWFARYGLAVAARNHLHEERKTSENLWYEETLPPDTVLYALLCERGAGGLVSLRALFDASPYLQVGGNETVGQGWLAVTLPEEHARTAATAGGGA
jgi:CRISPR-associated protein Cmr4